MRCGASFLCFFLSHSFYCVFGALPARLCFLKHIERTAKVQLDVQADVCCPCFYLYYLSLLFDDSAVQLRICPLQLTLARFCRSQWCCCSLGMNRFGGSGLAALAAALRENSSLTTLK